MDNEICAYFESPLGRILAVRNTRGFTRLDFQSNCTKIPPHTNPQYDKSGFEDLFEQLTDYFFGTLRGFKLSLAPEGTPFQLSVWKALSSIPYGSTVSYGALARKIGKPSAARAVGAANRANPLPIIVPCHRVIGSNGNLTGYAGGLHVKKALLDLEKGNLAAKAPQKQPKAFRR